MNGAHEIPVRLARIEAMHLTRLIDDLTRIIDAADESPDPAVERLTPAAYPEDADASREFATATREDLLDRRTADAAVVRRALAPFVDADLTAERARDVQEYVEIAVARGELDAWLRTLTALRLVIATRLGVMDEDAEEHEDPRLGTYDWLAYRLENLIVIADALDDRGEYG